LLAFVLSMPWADVRLRHTDKSNRARRFAVSELFLREREGVTPGGHDVCLRVADNDEVGESDGVD
jgi:hypothetical protein